jgi:hypothetical protein
LNFDDINTQEDLGEKTAGELIVYPLAIWESIFLTGVLISNIIINSMQLNCFHKKEWLLPWGVMKLLPFTT